MAIDLPWEQIFESAFQSFEQKCRRDGMDFSRYKLNVKTMVKDIHGITHLDFADCIQEVFKILSQGGLAYYRTRQEEIVKRKWPSFSKPKRESIASFSTLMFSHMGFKYNTFMTSFFAPTHALDSGIYRAKKGTPGKRLQKIEIDDPNSHWNDRQISSEHMSPDRVVMLDDFKRKHSDIIQMILAMSEKEVKRPHAKVKTKILRSIQHDASLSDMKPKELIQSIRFLFSPHMESA